MSSYLTGLLVILSINVIIAYGAYLPIVAGQLNLGVAGFMALGAYGSAYFSNTYGLPPLLTVFIGAGIAGLVGLVVAVPVLRTRGIYLALATFAFGQIVGATLLNIEAIGAAEGYSVPQYIGLEVIGPFAIGTVVIVVVLGRLRYGLNVTAVNNDEGIADLFGVNTRWFETAAVTLGAGARSGRMAYTASTTSGSRSAGGSAPGWPSSHSASWRAWSSGVMVGRPS